MEMLFPDAMGIHTADVRIRFARREDLPYLKREHAGLPTGRLERKVEGKEIVVGERNGELVGFLEIDFLGADTPYMSLIRVDPACRRQGIGKALLAFTEDHLQQQGSSVFYTSATGDEPEPQAWHRRMGFEPCGALEGFNEGGVPEVFFRKRLI